MGLIEVPYRDSLASYTQNQTWTTEPYAPLFSYPPDAKIFYNNYTVPNIFNEGDTFNFAEAGAIHTVPFYEDFQSWSNPGNQSQYHHKSYGTWPGSGTHYIGIKYFIGERIMLGWVKLSVEMNQIFLHKYVLKTVEEL